MDSLLSHCMYAFSADGGLLLAFFIGGLTGGFTHCLTMCGPIVACQQACRSPSCTSAPKIVEAMGLPYHLGRATTYGMAGFLAAWLSQQVAASSWWPGVASLMLGGAGALFLFSCFKPCASHASPAHSRSGLSYLYGVLLGFMPCGLLYAALMMAATLADPLKGMLAMWIFTLGTIPALMLASGGAAVLMRKWQRPVQRVGRAMMAFNGLSLMVMAIQIVR